MMHGTTKIKLIINLVFMYYLKLWFCEIFRKLIRIWLKSNKKAILPTSCVSDAPDKALNYKHFREHPELCSPLNF